MSEKDWSKVPGLLVTAEQAAGVEPASTLRPLFLIRTRLQDKNLWAPLADLLLASGEKMLRLLSAETPGTVDITDPDVIAMVRAVGADPAEILA